MADRQSRTAPGKRFANTVAAKVRLWWDRFVVAPCRRSLELLARKFLSLDPVRDSAEVIAPGTRDLHLFPVMDAMLPLLRYERLNIAELLAFGRRKRSRLFDQVDEALAWRTLTWAERRRYVSPVREPASDPRAWLWDLTPEGQTQISILRILIERAKFGGILAVAGFAAILLGVDEKKVVGIVFGGLVFFACWFWLQLRSTRWLGAYGMSALKARESNLRRLMSKESIEPWWTPLDGGAQSPSGNRE